MNDEDFRKLCNTFGFAPSRALRELIDCARAQEIEACAKVCDQMPELEHGWRVNLPSDCAAAIRARGME